MRCGAQAGARSASSETRGAPDVREADITDIDDEWAAIVFWHSLEHLRAPGASIDPRAEHLRPDGLLVVAVPNAASLQARAFGDRWFRLDLPRHLVHLPASALLERLRARGPPDRACQLLARRADRCSAGSTAWSASLPGRPDLYDAIRRPEARSEPLSGRRRALALAAGALCSRSALAAAVARSRGRRGGTVYVEAPRD